MKNKKYFYVILHNIRSAYNVGSIFRSSDAFGVDKIFLTGYTPTPDNHNKIKKTALGAEENIEWEYREEVEEVINQLKKEKVRVVALEQTDKSLPIDNFFQEDFSLGLILGNEVTGVEKEVLELVNEAVKISMFGKKESLNVSVAFGVAAYLVKNSKK
jgi:23S rRNA (guanosine2251-2'-O)-methyltransferase